MTLPSLRCVRERTFDDTTLAQLRRLLTEAMNAGIRFAGH
jgi:hypothetical protein